MRRNILIILVACGSLAATACSAFVPPAPDPSANSTASALPATATPSAPPAVLPVVAKRETAVKDVPAEVEVNELRVAGEVMTLTFSVRNIGSGGELVVGSTFSDGRRQPSPHGGQPPIVEDGYVDGVYVLDSARGRRHLPARDADGYCVCSANTYHLKAPAGGVVRLSALFKALPDGVERANVHIPAAGVFVDVPVTR